MNTIIRELMERHGGLSMPVSTIEDDSDLYAHGLTSFASVQLMLALEGEFGIEFPDHLMNRKCFATIHAIAGTVACVVDERMAA